uniref:Late embryogenesis abundant protein Lea5 n=1 Tax=Davidia involucrata TaxID=16924 RepID=A0A5B6YJ29_DAVIN
MASSLSSAKLLASSVVDGLSLAINRRGYAAAASRGAVSGAGVGKGGSRSGMVGKAEETAVIKEKSSWAPDPVTGYYKPLDRAAEIDEAELREMALNHKVKPH